MPPKIRVRDDDVLVTSRDWPDPFKRFTRVHRWIAEVPEHFIHVPAILVTEIQPFSECIEFVRSETKAGRMFPELHGLHHEINYQFRSLEDVSSDLKISVDWMIAHLDVRPKIWYTPKGAGLYPHPRAILPDEKKEQLIRQADTMRAAASQLNLEVVSEYDNKMHGENGICRHLMDGRSIDAISNSRKIEGGHKEISVHWWERGIRLKRVLEAVKHGSWANAMIIEPELFRD